MFSQLTRNKEGVFSKNRDRFWVQRDLICMIELAHIVSLQYIHLAGAFVQSNLQ